MTATVDGSRQDVPIPLRIVVVGGSVSLFVTPERTRREEGTYGEVLERTLRGAGIPAQVEHHGKWFDMVHELRRRYEPAIRNRFPDVLILNYGMGEAQPHVLPTWMSRHFTSWDRSTHPAALLYRRRGAPTLWRLARAWQRAGSQLVKMHTWRLSPARFAAEMRHVITMARADTGCLVLVLDCDPAGDRFEYWLPGMRRRWAVFQDVLRELVEGLGDPQVRLVAASSTIVDPAEDLPDGIHRTAAAHVRTAGLLHAEIIEWLVAREAVTAP